MYIKHSKQRFTKFKKPRSSSKQSATRRIFINPFLGFLNVVKRGLWCLIYYV